MKFIENGKLVVKEQDEKSKNCQHEIEAKLIGDTRYRYCKHCGIIAHEDGSFAYVCWSGWCRCMQ